MLIGWRANFTMAMSTSKIGPTGRTGHIFGPLWRALRDALPETLEANVVYSESPICTTSCVSCASALLMQASAICTAAGLNATPVRLIDVMFAFGIYVIAVRHHAL
jgi:hypothetical protein